jgi:hypothetical protein
MKPLPDIDQEHLNTAIGWLELGNQDEANDALEKISVAMRSHPDVLEARWLIYVTADMWEGALVISKVLTEVCPERSQSWLCHSECLRRCQGLEAAWQFLLPASLRFVDEPMLPYTLACYASQMGDYTEAEGWLRKAIDQGGDKVKKQALENPDLQPFWDGIRRL